MTENASEEFAGGKLAAALGAALLLGFAVVTAVAAYDKSRLAALEQITEPTAVGDRAFFPAPEKIEPEKSLLTFGGKALYGVERIKSYDGRMLKAGMDDSQSFIVYRADSSKADRANFYFLKIADERYLKARAVAK